MQSRGRERSGGWLAHVALHLLVRAGGEEEPHALGAAVAGRDHEGGVAPLVDRVGVGAILEEGAEAGLAAFQGRAVKRGPAALRTGRGEVSGRGEAEAGERSFSTQVWSGSVQSEVGARCS